MNIINFTMLFNYVILVSTVVKKTQDKNKNNRNKLKVN